MVRFMSVILKWIRMFSVIGIVWNCKFQFLEKRIFLFLNVTRLVIMLLMKRALQRLIDDIQQPAQTGIEINFHFHQSNCFYDNVLEFFQSLCLILAAFTYCKRIWNFNENDTACFKTCISCNIWFVWFCWVFFFSSIFHCVSFLTEISEERGDFF